MIIMNTSIIMLVLPFSLLFSVNLTSFLRVLIILSFILFVTLDVFHIFVGMIVRAIIKINHLIDIIEDLGSNTENRFVII